MSSTDFKYRLRNMAVITNMNMTLSLSFGGGASMEAAERAAVVMVQIGTPSK